MPLRRLVICEKFSRPCTYVPLRFPSPLYPPDGLCINNRLYDMHAFLLCAVCCYPLLRFPSMRDTEPCPDHEGTRAGSASGDGGARRESL